MGEVLDPQTPLARKNHKCYWCGEVIEAGTKYSRWTWVDAGSASTVRAHLECATAWNTLDDPDPIPAFMFCRGCTCEKPKCFCKKDGGEVKL